LNESTFVDGCSQCGDCLNVCPENIIKKGDGGFPEVDFLQGECTFCQKCVESCDQNIFFKLRKPLQIMLGSQISQLKPIVTPQTVSFVKVVKIAVKQKLFLLNTCLCT
jgi:ferredoxin-type protein NapF